MFGPEAREEDRVMRWASSITTVVLLIISLLHLMRLVLGLEVTVADWSAPMWISYFAVVASLVLAWGLWRERLD
jgi:hypothetical protein